MGEIIKTEKIAEVSQILHDQCRRIVLAGGVFDILHVGHITFLENAKKEGDVLFVLLESDQKVRKIKGDGRPINTQIDRAKVLSALSVVDYIIPLPPFEKDEEYGTIVSHIKPDVIATTKDDQYVLHKKRQAKMIGAEVKYVVERICDQSTTRLSHLLKNETL